MKSRSRIFVAGIAAALTLLSSGAYARPEPKPKHVSDSKLTLAPGHVSGSKLWTLTPNGSGADDSANTQAAFTAATTGPDAGPGAQIHFTGGPYWIKTMVLTNGFRGTVFGDGKDATRIMAGTSTGAPMNLPTSLAASKSNVVRLPNLFSFYEEGQTTGQDIEFHDMTLEAVDAPGLAEGSPNPVNYFSLPWWNRNIVAFIYVGAKKQALPINYSSAKASVGVTNLRVHNIDFLGHQRGPYTAYGNLMASNADSAINVDDWPSAFGPTTYGGDPTQYGTLQVPGDPAYFYYTGPEVPRTGKIDIHDNTFTNLGLTVFVKELFSKPASQPAQFYTFDGPTGAVDSYFKMSNNTFTNCGYSPAGANFDSAQFGAWPAKLVQFENNTFVASAGDIGGIWEFKVNGGAPLYGNTPDNWAWDMTSQPPSTIVVRNNTLDTNADGAFNLNFGGDPFVLLNSMLIANNTMTGVGSSGSELLIYGANNIVISGNNFAQGADAPAIFIDTCTNVQIRGNNRFNGMRTHGPKHNVELRTGASNITFDNTASAVQAGMLDLGANNTGTGLVMRSTDPAQATIPYTKHHRDANK